MKWKFMAKTVGMLLAFFGIDAIPLNSEGKEVAFSTEQEKLLAKKIGAEEVAKLKTALNSEIKAMTENDLDVKAIQDEIAAMVKELQLTEGQQAAIASNEGSDKELLASLKLIKEKQGEMAETIQKLIGENIGDQPAAIIDPKLKNAKVQHSATHVFASGKDFDAIVGRPWNEKAIKLANGNVQVGATDFTDQPTIQKLNDDMKLYYRENPSELRSLQRDKFGLPTFWPTRSKVDDLVADASIATAEVSQARKLPWLPKNKQTIQAEEGKIFPIQIDAEFIGFRLQKIEASWLNMMNKEGSQPYKESFVKFLVSEIDKKARQEDRVATIKGIYVETPETATEAGRSVNRQNGLLYLLQQARDVTKKYRAFDNGLPTTTNIVDYVDQQIKGLPLEVRESQGLVYYLSTEWLQAYKRRSETLFGSNMDYSGYPETPKDYPNVKFERLVDMAGSDFMFITYDDNIEILENVPAEKSMYKFEYLLRKMYIWADYKMGVRLIHIGNTVEAGDPDEFKVQTVWSNTAPIFPKDVFVPFHETSTGTALKLAYNNVYVAKDRTSNVVSISNYADYAGQVIKIKGDSALATNVLVKDDNAKINLTADFQLNTGGTLVLYVPLTGVPVEISRTVAPETATTADVSFIGNAVDANSGVVFKSAHTATTAITSIVNGVPGKTIAIYGTSAVGVNVTLSDVGNINVASAATLDTAADYIELTLIDGIWVETKRVIA
jgi:hypothetical protein